MGDLVAREHRRLRQAFGLALLAAAAPAPWLGCGASPTTSAPADASVGGLDAPPASGDVVDAGVAQDAGDADCAAIRALGCAPLIYPDAAYLDDAADAEICPLLLPCGLPQGAVIMGCEITEPEGGSIGCHVSAPECTGGVYDPSACGQLDLLCRCDLFVGGGRRSHRERPSRRPRARDPLGAYFARMAREEGASVHAFRRLGMELEALGAPAELRRLASASGDDEVRHARTMAGLSRLHGGPAVPVPHTRSPGAPRDLGTMARENAVQGCVRETYGALLARWQAAHAVDPRVRGVMRRIASDETRHAALAWAVARWADTRLDDAARARVVAAARRARRALAAELLERPHPALARVVGLPTPRRARGLFDAIFHPSRTQLRARRLC